MTCRTTIAACASLLLAMSYPAIAETTVLSVSGSISPASSCEMTVGNGLVDLGRIARGDLNPDPSQPTVLDTQRVKMHITCEAPSRYALIATSASRPEGDDAYDFGLVSDADQTSAGSLYIRFDNAAAHIEGARGYYTTTSGVTDLGAAAWGPSTFSIVPIPNGSFALGFVTEDGSYEPPSYIRNFDTYLLVVPTIRPVNDLNLVDEFAFSGGLGFEIAYF